MTSSPENETALPPPAKILYYCKECRKVIQPVRVGNKFQFRCNECKNKSVTFGTQKSIANFYDVEGGNPTEEPDEKDTKKFKDFDQYLDAMRAGQK